MLAAGAVVYRYPPTQYSFYPRCPFHAAFGILCPGCGGTRAVAALLHGQWLEAWRDNALLMMLMPSLLAFVALSLARALRSGPRGSGFRWPQPPAPAIYAVGVLAVAFTLARNLR